MRPATAFALFPLVVLAGCMPLRSGPPTPAGYPEARSLLGQPLYAPELPLAQRQRLEAELAAARAAYDRAPEDPDALIRVGRRMAELGRYRDAIGVFTEGIRRHPGDARMYRHRGHRHLTVREFGRAQRDLERAAWLVRSAPDAVESDGAPAAHGASPGSLHFDVWYHLGIAYYLQGRFGRAAGAFRNALSVVRSDTSRVAATDWLYMSLRRAGREEEAAQVLAPIHGRMAVGENEVYLRRLLMYKGQLPPDSLLESGGRDAPAIATLGYGVGNWYLYNDRADDAQAVFWRVTSAENWAPFGYIAAEAELRRAVARARRR